MFISYVCYCSFLFYVTFFDKFVEFSTYIKSYTGRMTEELEWPSLLWPECNVQKVNIFILPRVVVSSKFPLWDHVNMFVNLSTISFKNMFVKSSAML